MSKSRMLSRCLHSCVSKHNSIKQKTIHLHKAIATLPIQHAHKKNFSSNTPSTSSNSNSSGHDFPFEMTPASRVGDTSQLPWPPGMTPPTTDPDANVQRTPLTLKELDALAKAAKEEDALDSPARKAEERRVFQFF